MIFWGFGLTVTIIVSPNMYIYIYIFLKVTCRQFDTNMTYYVKLKLTCKVWKNKICAALTGSYRRFGTDCSSHLPDTWQLKMGLIGCPETSVTTNPRCVISHSSEYLVDTAAEAWNRLSIIIIISRMSIQECIFAMNSEAVWWGKCAFTSYMHTWLAVLVGPPWLLTLKGHALAGADWLLSTGRANRVGLRVHEVCLLYFVCVVR